MTRINLVLGRVATNSLVFLPISPNILIQRNAVNGDVSRDCRLISMQRSPHQGLIFVTDQQRKET